MVVLSNTCYLIRLGTRKNSNIQPPWDATTHATTLDATTPGCPHHTRDAATRIMQNAPNVVWIEIHATYFLLKV